MSIYTRTGDDGTTALFGGKRVLKCEELVDVYGSIDELNCWIGLVNSRLRTQDLGHKSKDSRFFQSIQEDLFTIGSTMAGWPSYAKATEGKKSKLEKLEERVLEMEKQIDEWEKELPQLNNFILPGGSESATYVHIARAICRRVERQAVALKVEKVQEVRKVRNEDMNMIIQYLNRLSDLLFTLARIINRQENVEEVVWSGNPRQNK